MTRRGPPEFPASCAAVFHTSASGGHGPGKASFAPRRGLVRGMFLLEASGTCSGKQQKGRRGTKQLVFCERTLFGSFRVGLKGHQKHRHFVRCTFLNTHTGLILLVDASTELSAAGKVAAGRPSPGAAAAGLRKRSGVCWFGGFGCWGYHRSRVILASGQKRGVRGSPKCMNPYPAKRGGGQRV